MKHINAILIIGSIVMYGCNRKNETLTITINISNPDTCIELSGNDSISFRRDFEILENTLSDTVGLGGVLCPGQSGKRLYLKEGDGYLYVVTPEEAEDLPPIHTICFTAYLKRPVHGGLRLRFKRYY